MIVAERIRFANAAKNRRNILARTPMPVKKKRKKATCGSRGFAVEKNNKEVGMKQSEKIISAITTIALGIVLIALQASFIEVLVTIAGAVLIVIGVVDLVQKIIPMAVLKIVIGVIIIICGLAIVEAVLYVVAAVLLIAGILLLYDKIKHRVHCDRVFFTILEYAKPCIMLVIGVLLLFNQEDLMSFIFITGGILTILEGGIMLTDAILDR